MASIRSGIILSAAGAGATVLLATAAGTAAAASGGKFQTIYSLTDGPCVAVVDSSVHGPGYPNSATFTVSANLIGVGPCGLDVTLHWRNLDTGQTGTRSVHPTGPGYWISDPKSSVFSPGIGRFSGTVVVSTPHVPESGQVLFDIPPYQG